MLLFCLHILILCIFFEIKEQYQQKERPPQTESRRRRYFLRFIKLFTREKEKNNANEIGMFKKTCWKTREIVTEPAAVVGTRTRIFNPFPSVD